MDCGPCSRVNQSFTTKGENWCFHCKEALCSRCEFAHKKNQFSFAHHILPHKPTRKIVSMERNREFELPETEGISCMAVLSNGDLMIITHGEEGETRFIQLLNSQGELKSKVKIAYSICCFALIPGTNKAVLLKSDKFESALQYIDTNSMKLGKKVLIGDGTKPYTSIFISDENIYLCDTTHRITLDLDGKINSEIYIEIEEMGISEMRKLAFDSQKNMYFVDAVHLHKSTDEGKHLYSYGQQWTSSKYSKFSECHLDHNEYIYVLGYYFNEDVGVLRQLSPDGILVHDNICNEPIFPSDCMSMCFNTNYTEMYITGGKGTIIVYTCKANEEE